MLKWKRYAIIMRHLTEGRNGGCVIRVESPLQSKQNTIQQQSQSPSDVCECKLSCLSNGKALQKESKGLLLYEEEKGKPTVLSSRTNSSTSYSSLGSVCVNGVKGKKQQEATVSRKFCVQVKMR